MPFGIENPGAFFDEKNDIGNVELGKRRTENKRKNQKEDRPPKTWRSGEAGPLVGRSKSWITEYDKDVPKDASNKGLWSLERIEMLREQIGTQFKRKPGSEAFRIAFVKLKGGVGNTTTACHLAHRCAMRGLKTLYVDFDPQGTGTSVIGGFHPDIELDPDDLPLDALLRNPSELKYTIRETYFRNVDLIPASGLMASVDVDLHFQSNDPEGWPVNEEGEPISPYARLAEGLKAVEEHYDVILFDCSPRFDTLTLNALTSADSVINILRPAGADVQSYNQLCASMAYYYSQVPRPLRYFRIAFSQWADNGSCHRENALMQKWFGEYMLGSTISANVEISRAIGSMHTVFSMYKHESSRLAYNNGVKTMEKACDEIIDDMMKIWDLEEE